MLYNSTPGTTGAYDIVHSGSSGYVNLSQNIPFYGGRSKIADIPEYERDPGLLSKDILMEITEGRLNLMRLLYDYASRQAPIEFPDVKFRWRVRIKPTDRFYLKQAAYTYSGGKTTFKLTDYTRPTQSYPKTTGNPRVKGDISRLQEGDFILLMFSWLAVGRTGNPSYTESYSTPLPEIAKVISVNYDAGSFVCDRNWAGSQRTATAGTPPTVTVVANTATLSSNQVFAKNAFFVKLPRTVKEDEIDAKVFSFTNTWSEGIMQRTLEAWGAGHFQDVINANLGRGNQYNQNMKDATERFYDKREYSALFGEKDEGFDDETEDWWGLTDGLLANIPASHWIGLVPMKPQLIRSGAYNGWGSFDIPIFNKILEDKVYYGSGRKIMLCSNKAFGMFSTMINQMTQNVPDIKTDWKVVGKSFTSSSGLTVDFVPSDKMSLNGLGNKMIMFDPQSFRKVGLKGYPDADVIEVANQNPLKRNGFIHGVFGFVDMNPDAHWVFTLDDNLATTTGATYAEAALGIPLED